MKILNITITLLISGLSTELALGGPAAKWSFDGNNPSIAIESVSGKNSFIAGHARRVEGVRGSAFKGDGFTTRLTDKRTTLNIANGFTVQAWVAPQEYSWNWTGIVDQENEHREGFSFGINHLGQVGLSLAIDGEWQTVLSKASIPLLKWSHLAASYHPDGSIAVYMNGKVIAKQSLPGKVTASKVPLWIGMSHTKQWPALTERAVSKIPSFMIFDGLIDEVQLEASPLGPEAILSASQSLTPPNPQPLEYRKMPSGPDGPAPFGAYFTRLNYSPEWDRLWRVSDHPDVVVRFDESSTKVVFWRGTSYVPAWVTGDDRWVSDQGPEIYKKQCFEHMSDKQCRFSHVRVIENLPSRVLVHWRTALPNIKYESVYADSMTGWQPWGDDYYYIYPDGVCVRYQRAWGPKLHEFQQIEVLCQPGTKPEDVMKTEAITVMDMNGDTNTFSWSTRHGKRLPAEKQVEGPIQITNLKSSTRHFVIGETGAYFKRFTFGAIKGYTKFPNWNHWPVAQLPNDGCRAAAPDRPSSTCPGTLFPIRHKGEGVQEYVRNLYGMTDRDPSHLAVLARSWNHAPELQLKSKAYSNQGYDKNERAYQLTHTGASKPEALVAQIQASEAEPLVNLAIVVKDWGNHKAHLKLNGQAIPESKAFRVGYRRQLEGTDLIVWIQVDSQQPVTLSLSAQ